ncbi:DUF3237 domain-containing protein [Novosphingobium colocasiae]|uniref:UPF0311 protein GCM10011614_34430 n=1 Tax=Novosphingobium colocasiae TaxID=1256513 RepID=A0A918UKR5_9SPHN|nr:DUF3237 domain-containing protein [Novosphingobium colocasiae]GGZ16932.1 UPF0311 protein [Novosphingobium colocasiae]
MGPNFRPLFSIAFTSTPRLLGDVPAGYLRRISAISGGEFVGDRMRGRVLPGGGDWVVKRHDGVMHMDVRALLETDSGALVYMTYTGRLVVPADMVLPPPPDAGNELYFRSAVQFETADHELVWLNNIVAFGLGAFSSGGPTYEIYELL